MIIIRYINFPKVPSYRLLKYSKSGPSHTKKRVPLSSTPPQLNTSVPHKRIPKIPQFNTSLISTPKTPQFHTKNPSVPHTSSTEGCVELRDAWNWGVFRLELRGFCVEVRGFGVKLRGVLNWGVFGVKLRGFWCGTEGVLVWNWGAGRSEGFFSVELRDFGVKLTDFGCWKGMVLVWNRCVELRGLCRTEWYS